MGQKIQTKLQQVGSTIGVYGLWLASIALWVLVAIQFQRVILVVGNFIIETPAIKPVGWNSETLNGISRCGFVIAGALLLGVIIYTERYLREAAAENQLMIRAGRLFLIGGGLLIFGIGIFYLFV